VPISPVGGFFDEYAVEPVITHVITGAYKAPAIGFLRNRFLKKQSNPKAGNALGFFHAALAKKPVGNWS
jgi:hypothetical protein